MSSQSQIIDNFNKYKDAPESNILPPKLVRYLGIEKTDELITRRNEEYFTQSITLLLNKININNFDTSVSMIKSLNMTTQKQFAQVIDIILDKIRIETNFINIYARLINEIKLLQDGNKCTIEKLILFKCQNIFADIISGKTDKDSAQNMLKFISYLLKNLNKPSVINFCLDKLFELIMISNTIVKKTLALLYFGIFFSQTGKYVCLISKTTSDYCRDKFEKLNQMASSEEFQNREMINAKTIILDLNKLKKDEGWDC
jgi:hypothetical protein